MPNGQIQKEFTDTLAELGKWMQQYGSSIYGTRGNIVPVQEWGVVTAKNNNWFLHILNRPTQQPYIFLPQVKEKVLAASLLKDKSLIKFKQQAEGVFIYLDGIQVRDIDTVIQLSFQ